MSINLANFYDEILKNEICFFTGVPDSLLKEICGYISEKTNPQNHIISANEGSAIGIATGYHLATGKIPLIYMQNSGLGNAVNPLTSLTHQDVYKIPMLILIGWRGEPNQIDEPQHLKQGAITPDLLHCLDIPTLIVGPDEPKDLPNLKNAIKLIKDKNSPVALLIKKNSFEKNRSIVSGRDESKLLSREDAIRYLLQIFSKDTFFISTTGMASRELYELRAEGDRCHGYDFLTVGSMGHSSSIALGIALAKKSSKIVCLDGDGSAIMHLGSLAIIGSLKPKNLIHVILNNGSHDSVGGQPTVGKDISFTSVAAGLKYHNIFKVSNKEEIELLSNKISFSDGPTLIEVIIKKGARTNLGRPKSSPEENKKLFMNNLF